VVDVGATTHKSRWRYAIVTGLCAAVVAVGTCLYHFGIPATQTEAQTFQPANPVTPASEQTAFADEPPTLSLIQTDQGRAFAGQARRLAASGDFAGAEIELKKAEKAAPGLEVTAQARLAIAELKTPQGQLTTWLNRARSAFDLGDNTAAEQAISEAERLHAPASTIAELRADLEADRQKNARKNDHISSLLAEMRTAAARHDFATANRALNEAERLDIRDRDVLEARDELTKERDSARPPAKN
jgi:hypothetical protein